MGSNSLFNNQDQRILNNIFELSRKKKLKVYIVGGLLRDIILNRSKQDLDIDFAVRRQAISFSRKLAAILNAGFVILDRDNGCARLVKKTKDRLYFLDFTDFRGRLITEDLGKRDFTINALAIELESFLKVLKTKGKKRINFLINALIDPYQGLVNLRSGVIKAINNYVFDDDALRILRAFSLSCVLNFKIETKTLKLAVKKKNKLKAISSERIRDELFKIMSSSRAFEFLTQLDRHRIIDIIIPQIKAMRRLQQGPYHHLDVWGHTLATVKHLEKIIADSK